MSRPFIVYRDRLFARSEGFIARMYQGFEKLQPIYLGHRLDGPPRADGHRLGEFAAHPLEVQWFRQLGRVPPRLRRWLEELAPALIHAQFGRGGALALPLAEALELPLVVTFHGGDATKAKHYRNRPLVPTIYQRRRVRLAERAALILCVSEHIRRTLIGRGFPEAKLRVHHLGVERPRELDRRAGPEARRLLFAGRLVEKKGVDLLLRAAARVGRVEVEVHGDGPLRAQLERLAGDLGLPCRFAGWSSPADVRAAMAGASVLAVPSRTAASGDAEGVPTVIYEALAHGLPIVATRHAGIPEAVVDGVSGLLAEENDVEGLAAAITRLLDDGALWRELQAGGLEAARTRFDAGLQSKRLERLLLEVADRRRCRSWQGQTEALE